MLYSKDHTLVIQVNGNLEAKISIFFIKKKNSDFELAHSTRFQRQSLGRIKIGTVGETNLLNIFNFLPKLVFNLLEVAYENHAKTVGSSLELTRSQKSEPITLAFWGRARNKRRTIGIKRLVLALVFKKKNRPGKIRSAKSEAVTRSALTRGQNPDNPRTGQLMVQ
jgi:hypothetical protein